MYKTASHLFLKGREGTIYPQPFAGSSTDVNPESWVMPLDFNQLIILNIQSLGHNSRNHLQNISSNIGEKKKEGKKRKSNK